MIKNAKIWVALLLITVMTVAIVGCSNSSDTKGPEQQETTKKTDTPKAEAPKAEAPKADAPKADAPKAEAPKAEAPKAEAPKAEAPKLEGKVIYQANFDDGKAPKGFTTEFEKIKTTGKVTLEDKAIKLERPEADMAAYDEEAVLAAGFDAEGTRCELVLDEPVTTGIVTAEYKLMTPDLNGNKQFQIIGFGVNSEGEEGDVNISATNLAKKNIQIGPIPDGKATKIGSVVENEWFTFRVVVDIANNNVDYYLNGEKVHSQVMQNAATNVKALRANIGGKQSGILFVDDVTVTVK